MTMSLFFFLDSDEYYESKTGNVQEDIKLIKEKFGEFDGLSLGLEDVW